MYNECLYMYHLTTVVSLVLTSGGIIPLLEGGMTTLKSGFRFPMLMFPPGGGGDFVGMTFPSPFPLGVPRSPGDPLVFRKPFPVETHRHGASQDHVLIIRFSSAASQVYNTPFRSCSHGTKWHATLSVPNPLGK